MSARTISYRRRDPTGPISEQAAAGRGREPPAARSHRRSERSERGSRRRASRRRAVASAASSRRVGAGRAGRSGPGDGAPSASAASTARPPTPSATTWCSTTSSALPPSARPVTTTADHNGRPEGSGVVVTAAARSSRARSSPGGGHEVRRTWLAGSAPGSSTQTGGPQPSGDRSSRCRRRGIAPARSATSRCSAAGSPPPGLPGNRRIAPTCDGSGPRSIANVITSPGVARSTASALGVGSMVAGRQLGTGVRRPPRWTEPTPGTVRAIAIAARPSSSSSPTMSTSPSVTWTSQVPAGPR